MAKGHAGGLSRKECESRGTLMELLERYPDEEPCERRLLEEKHPGGFVCPVCGNRTSLHLRGRQIVKGAGQNRRAAISSEKIA